MNWKKEKKYDTGLGYIVFYSLGNFTIYNEGNSNWYIEYKNKSFEGVSGFLPTLKIAKLICESYLKADY